MSTDKNETGKESKNLPQPVTAQVAKTQPPSLTSQAKLGAHQQIRSADPSPADFRNRLINHYLSMGNSVLARETWTIDDFAWLLAGRNPTQVPNVIVDPDAAPFAKHHKESYTVLKSCVGASLIPVKSSGLTFESRFKVKDLMKAASARQLGYAPILESVLRLFDTESGQSPIPDSNSKVSAAVGATATGHVQTKWKLIVDEMCADILQAVENGHLDDFKPDALPWSPKLIFSFFVFRCQQQDIVHPPIKIATLRKHLNLTKGWKAKPGYQKEDASAKLRKLFGF